MRIILSIILIVFSIASFAQSGSAAYSGVKYRVNDTTAYQSAIVSAHAQGYSDIYWNNQATTPHWDIWNGSSYDHIFDFNSGGGGSGNVVGPGSSTDNAIALWDGTTGELLKDGPQIDDGPLASGTAADVPTKDAVVTKLAEYPSYTDFATSRTVTSATALVQSDNLRIVYTDCAAPCNVTVDLLSAGTQVTVINIGAATATLIEGSGITLPGSTVDIAPDENAVIIYRVAATPDVWAGSSSGGTVTSASVVSANGFAGSVATATTTPAITLSTTVTGVLKGNGTAISAATNADLPVMTSTVGGAVPTPPNNTTTFLRGDGTFAAPTGSGDVTGPASSVDSEVAIFNSTTGKIIKRASATGWAKLTSGVLSAITPGTNVETFVTTPTYTNFLAAVTGTSPYYLTASGGAATASNTKTFNTANWDNTTSTYTTTGNGQYASNSTGTITHRATVSDFTYGHTTSRTFVTSANTQRSVDLWLKPVFTNGAFSNPENFSLLAETGTVVVGAPTGSAIPITQKMKIFGGTTSSTDIGFEVVDSGNVPLLKVFNNGTINVKSNGIVEWQNANARIRSEATASLSFALDANHPTSGGFRFRAHAAAQTATNDYPITTVEGTFSPTSGAARWIGMKQIFTINQTGTASGDIVGYHYAPTIGGLLGKNIAFLSESGQHLFNGTTVTASTTVDVRGVSSGTVARFANNSNTELWDFKNDGSLEIGGSAGTAGQVPESAGAGAAVIWGAKGTETVAAGTAAKITQVSGATTHQTYEMPWFDGTANSGNQDWNILGAYTDAVAVIEFTITGIKTGDGSEIYTAKKVASFHKDGSANAVIVGSVEDLFTPIENAPTNVPNATISMSGANVRVSYDLGGGVDTYRWTIFAKVTITQL